MCCILLLSEAGWSQIRFLMATQYRRIPMSTCFNGSSGRQHGILSRDQSLYAHMTDNGECSNMLTCCSIMDTGKYSQNLYADNVCNDLQDCKLGYRMDNDKSKLCIQSRVRVYDINLEINIFQSVIRELRIPLKH